MFKLAGHLGMTVLQLKQSLTEEELVDWIAYDKLDPIGGYRLDANFARLIDAQIGTDETKLSDFLLVDPNPTTDEEMDRQAAEEEKLRYQQQAEAMAQYFAKAQNIEIP